jgi:Ca2+-binding RTX toxin-like protein
MLNTRTGRWPIALGIFIVATIAGASGPAAASHCPYTETRLNDNDNYFSAGSDQYNVVYTYGGSDSVEAWDCQDSVFGGTGHDRLMGEGHKDILYGEDGSEKANQCPTGLYCGAIIGGSGNDEMHGGPMEDELRNTYDETAYFFDTDKAWGGDGNDVIYLKDGDQYDSAYGNGGNDSCRLDWYSEDPNVTCEQYF